MKNFEEIGKALVAFHIGRGGQFHNPGHVTYNPWVKSFKDVLHKEGYFINDEDENGNPLDDEDWTLTDCNGEVMLEGRDKIEADTGSIAWDGIYDADYVKRLGECDDSELKLIYKEGFHHTLMDEDLLAYCRNHFLEPIWQGFKETTGKDLPIYSYDGQLGVIYETQSYNCWVPEFILMDDFLKRDDIDYDRVRWVTVGADGCEEGEEITDDPVRNDENDQNLLVDCVWSPVNYNKSDEFVRELLVTTTQYYSWTSERKRMIDSIQQILEKYDEKLGYYNGMTDDELDADEIKERDEDIKSLKSCIKNIRQEWEKTCNKYEDPLGWKDFEKNSIDFGNVYQETILGYEPNDIVRNAVSSVIESGNN